MHRDLGRTVQTERKPDRSDSSIDVKLCVPKSKVPFDIFAAHGRKNDRTCQREPDLSAVRVTGKNQVNCRRSRMLHDSVCIIRGMSHENDRRTWVFRKALVEIWSSRTRVIRATDPETVSPSFKRCVVVDENRDSIGNKSPGHHRGSYRDVVVPENRVARGALQSAQDLSAAVSCVLGGDKGQGSPGDEVAGEQHRIRRESVDVTDDTFKKVRFRVLVQVNIAHLDDSEALEGEWQVGDGDVLGGEVEFMPGNLTGVESHTGRDCS